jgi:hypothetical protein
MPSLKDLFNPSVLLFLGILLIVVGGLIVYIESKSREQNHKITSMLSLVSSLAEELNSVKFRLNNTMSAGSGPGSGLGSGSGSRNGITKMPSSDDSLVTVSDNDCDDDLESLEDEDDDDEDDDEDDEADDDDEADEDEDEDDDISNNVIDITEQKNIKILTLTLNNNIDDDSLVEEDSMIEELDDDDISIQSSEDIHEKEKENEPEFGESVKLFDLKSINISSLEESTQNNEPNDLKKQPVSKLRSIAIEKGLSTDPSKLKKQELLKMLGIE